jgi:hypothetical protein
MSDTRMQSATATTRSGLTEAQKMANAQAAAAAAAAKSAAKQGMSGLLDSFKGMNFGAPAAPAAMEEGGRRRRTRRNKGKGKKRGGADPCDDLKEQIKELEEGIARRDRQLGRRGGTRKHKKHSRKTRRGGVDEIREIKEAKELAAKLAALKNDPTATPAQIAAAEKEYQKADNIARNLKRMRGSERFISY